MKKQPSVFISYSHSQKAVAIAVKKHLETHGFKVSIDLECLTVGQDLKQFIISNIRNNDVVLSIICAKSLGSTWVAMESVNAFFATNFTDKKFLAAFTSPCFFQRDFVDDTLDKIEVEIADIDAKRALRQSKHRNTDDLDIERSRFLDLHHFLPSIVMRLTASLSADISDGNFESGMQQVVDAIK